MDLSFERRFQMAIVRLDLAIEAILRALHIIIPVVFAAVVVTLVVMLARTDKSFTK